MDVWIISSSVNGHRAQRITVKPDVVARNESIGTAQWEPRETGFHVERCSYSRIVEGALQCDGILTIKNQVSGHAGCGQCRIKIKVGIQGHVALFLAVIHKVLDIDSTVTVGIGAVPIDIYNCIYCAAGLIEHGYNARPLVEVQVVDVEQDILGAISRQANRCEFDAATVAVEHQVGVNHARAQIYVHKVVCVEFPVAVTDNGILAKEAQRQLIIGQMGIAAQTVPCLTLDILLMQQEVYRLSPDASFDIDLCILIPCAGTIPHVGIEGKVLVIQLVGMDSNRVDIVLAITDTMRPAVKEQRRVAAHFATDIAEVNLMLLQIALHDTVSTHVHVKVEPGHWLLEAFDVYPSVIHLTLNLLSGILEVLDQFGNVTGGIQVSIIGLVLNGNTSYVRRAVQLGVSIVGDKQAAVKLPIDVVEGEICIPVTCTQVDVTVGM